MLFRSLLIIPEIINELFSFLDLIPESFSDHSMRVKIGIPEGLFCTMLSILLLYALFKVYNYFLLSQFNNMLHNYIYYYDSELRIIITCYIFIIFRTWIQYRYKYKYDKKERLHLPAVESRSIFLRFKTQLGLFFGNLSFYFGACTLFLVSPVMQ